RLFDALARHWLHVGGVTRIANGADLDTRDLLAVLRGRGIGARQQTLRELAAQSDVVLVDLRRSGSADGDSNAEFVRLLDATDLERVVFVVEDAADLGI